MIIDIDKKKSGTFPIPKLSITQREGITVLPADDPNKPCLSIFYWEPPWMRCFGFGVYAMHTEKSISIKSTELMELSEKYRIDVETFQNLLFSGSLDADRILFWLEVMRYAREKDSAASESKEGD